MPIHSAAKQRSRRSLRSRVSSSAGHAARGCGPGLGLIMLMTLLGGCPAAKELWHWGRDRQHGHHRPHGPHSRAGKGGSQAGAGGASIAGQGAPEEDGGVCAPSCRGKRCGGDGCGGSCGECPDGTACVEGGCVCVPDCDGRQCGDDGCGDVCGSCPPGSACIEGACACIPACIDRQCGDNGCGGSCGQCPDGASCDPAGRCVRDCIPDCTGRECGLEACGSSCGSCPDDQLCSPAGRCTCAPRCSGRQCGPDGCGGTCGSCEPGQQCDAELGACSAVASFEPVFALLQQFDCGSCHSGDSPPQGLSLATAGDAYAQLVNQPAQQCRASMPGRMRVAPGAPDASYLINKLTGEGMCGGQRMPRNRGDNFMRPEQIELIRAWIAAGAPP